MKIAITGGHLSPALAVIENLKGEEIIFFGRRYGLEADMAESFEYKTIISLGIPFYEVKTGRFQRKITKNTISSLLKIPFGFQKSLSVLRKTKPNVVIGFGGYVSLPVILAAYSLRIPVVIHEQTLNSGIANKVAAIFAKTVCVSWPSSLKYFPKQKTILTGNPLRNEILNVKYQKEAQDKNSKDGQPLIYITGGSLGSHQINILTEKVLKELLKEFEVIHQTGDSKEYSDYERLLELRKNLPKDLQEKYTIDKFFPTEKAVRIMQKADLVVGRSGINTVTEILYLQKPCLLIPLSVGQKNEQLKNALFAKEAGVAEVLIGEVEPTEFLNAIKNMMENREKYKIRNEIAINPNSADLIIKELKKAAK